MNNISRQQAGENAGAYEMIKPHLMEASRAIIEGRRLPIETPAGQVQELIKMGSGGRNHRFLLAHFGDCRELKDRALVDLRKTNPAKYAAIILVGMRILQDYVVDAGIELDVVKNYTLSFDNGKTVSFFGNGVTYMARHIANKHGEKVPVFDEADVRYVVRDPGILFQTKSKALKAVKEWVKGRMAELPEFIQDDPSVLPSVDTNPYAVQSDTAVLTLNNINMEGIPKEEVRFDGMSYEGSQDLLKDHGDVVYVLKGRQSFLGAEVTYEYKDKIRKAYYSVNECTLDNIKNASTAPVVKHPRRLILRKLKNTLYRTWFGDCGYNLEVHLDDDDSVVDPGRVYECKAIAMEFDDDIIRNGNTKGGGFFNLLANAEVVEADEKEQICIECTDGIQSEDV